MVIPEKTVFYNSTYNVYTRITDDILPLSHERCTYCSQYSRPRPYWFTICIILCNIPIYRKCVFFFVIILFIRVITLAFAHCSIFVYLYTYTPYTRYIKYHCNYIYIYTAAEFRDRVCLEFVSKSLSHIVVGSVYMCTNVQYT